MLFKLCISLKYRGQSMERRIEKRQLANIMALFLIVQFGGLLVAFYIVPPSQIYMLSASAPQANTQGLTFLVELVIVIAIGSLFMIVFFRHYKGMLLFKLIEAYAIGVPTFLLSLFLIGTTFPNLTLPEAVAASILIAGGLVLAKNRWPKLRNTATVIASIGIGVYIGFSGFMLAYLLLTIIAVYDYIAVFVTKHMQVMARAMVERNLAFLIGSSDVQMTPGKLMSEKQKEEFVKAVKKGTIKISDPEIKRMIKEGAYPSMSQVALGGGDLALTLVLVVGTYIGFSSLFIPVMIILGSLAGLLATMRLLEKYNVPLPAIPPLFAFMNLSLAISLFITGKASVLVCVMFVLIAGITMQIILITLKKNQNGAQKS